MKIFSFLVPIAKSLIKIPKLGEFIHEQLIFSDELLVNKSNTSFSVPVRKMAKTMGSAYTSKCEGRQTTTICGRYEKQNQ
jgi:hypothetical protein